MWKNNLHPSVNREKWSKCEDEKMTKLILEPDKDGLIRPRKDWDWIAKKLATNRSSWPLTLIFIPFLVPFWSLFGPF